MSAATEIAGKDLKLRLRDRSAIIIGIIAPLALGFIFNIVFGNTLGSGELDLDYGLVDLDRSDSSAIFGDVLQQLDADDVLTVTGYESAGAAEGAIEEGMIDAFYLIEPGMGDAVIAGEDFVLKVFGDIDAPTSTQIAASIAEQFGDGVTTVQLSVGTAIALNQATPSPTDIATWAQEASSRGQSFVISDVSAETRQLDPTTFFAAGMAVFFLFFTVQFGVSGILEEERDGTLARLLAAPIPRTAVIAGKAILAFALGLISMAVLVVATRLLMGASWGHPIGVAILVIAGVLSAVAIMGLVASIAKSPEGAGNLGSIIAVILGMLGGTFFPVGQGDDLLSRLSLATPHAWFMRGLGDLADGAPWNAALPAAGAMLAFALLSGSVAWFLLTRRMAR